MPVAVDGRRRIVIDASAAVFLLASSDPRGDSWAASLAYADLAAPVHLPVEVDNALRGLELGRRLSPAQADVARSRFREQTIDLWDWELLCDRAWELRANLTMYDAGYVALAEFIDAELVTADARIARAPGIRCPVSVIS